MKYHLRKVVIVLLSKYGKLLSDKLYLKSMFKCKMGYSLNLKKPRTFNEKLQWLKLHDRKPLYTILVDKYAVKDYVSKCIGSEYIIPTLGIWDRFEDINFDLLPNKFVLKCTHDSGGLIICKDKNTLDKELARKKLNNCLKYNFYYYGREWPYKYVRPRIIAEQFMQNYDYGNFERYKGSNFKTQKEPELNDYKFFCFDGNPVFFKVDFDRFTDHHANYYKTNGELLPFGEQAYPPIPDRELSLPNTLPNMIEIAKKLSQGIPFVRIDLYEVCGKVFFGEMTFYPSSGMGKLSPPEWDLSIGNMLVLPKVFNQKYSVSDR